MEEKRKRGQKRKDWKYYDKRFIEYYEKNYPEWTDEMRMCARDKYNKEINYQCIEYYIKNYPNLSLEECESLRKQRILDSKSNRPQCIEYYIKNYPDLSIEECKEKLSEYSRQHNFQNIEYYKRIFPEKSLDELNHMLIDSKTNYANKRPDISGINNPAHHTKTTEKQRRERSVLCIEYWEKHYPQLSHDEHLKLMNDKKHSMIQKAKNTPQQTGMEYWMLRGYTEDEAKQKVHERQQTFTLKKCIEKHGEKKGLEMFKNRQDKWLKSLQSSFQKNGDGRSYQSKFTKSLIKNICDQLNIEVPIKEKYIMDPQLKRSYAYDFTHEHKIIEFNGDYWHCNPSKYTATYFNNVKKQYASEIWEYDKTKIECAKKHGYDVLIVWEGEYIQDPFKTLQKCVDFINHE